MHFCCGLEGKVCINFLPNLSMDLLHTVELAMLMFVHNRLPVISVLGIMRISGRFSINTVVGLQ